MGVSSHIICIAPAFFYKVNRVNKADRIDRIDTGYVRKDRVDGGGGG